MVSKTSTKKQRIQDFIDSLDENGKKIQHLVEQYYDCKYIDAKFESELYNTHNFAQYLLTNQNQN